MVGWIPIGLLATLSRQNNAGVMSNRQLATEYIGMVRELQALATVKEIPLIDLGPYHVKTWCQGTAEEAIEKVLTSPLSGSQSTHSALQDIQKGIPTEFQACVGPILEEAQALSISDAASTNNVCHTYGVGGHPAAPVSGLFERLPKLVHYLDDLPVNAVSGQRMFRDRGRNDQTHPPSVQRSAGSRRPYRKRSAGSERHWAS